MRKIVLLAFVFLLFSAAVVVGFVRPVVTDGTIYIRSDGSVEGTDKIQRDGNVYTFTGNINDSIVVERDNIVIDGAGYTLRGDGGVEGIWLENRRNVTIKNMQITHFGDGIRIMGNGSQNNTIIGNNITDNGHETYGNGIELTFGASHNTIYGNNITGNWEGVFLYMSGDNIISENYITANRWDGVWICAVNNSIIGNDIIKNGRGVLVEIGSNIVYHNNFVNNTVQAVIGEAPPVVSIWDDGYPSGGNYWSDYTGEDANSDGIGDTPYVINDKNQDRYPLMKPGIIPVPDTTPPAISIVSPENKTYTVNNVSLTFTVSEQTSWIGYSLDRQANVTIVENTTLTGLSLGEHSLIVYARDVAGNNGTSETIYFSIAQPSEPFPITWIVIAIMIIAVVGAALLVYFAKVKKTTGKAE